MPSIRGSTKKTHSGECNRIGKQKRWIAIALAVHPVPGKAAEEEFGRVAEKETLAPLKEDGYGIRATEILATGEDSVQEDPNSFKQYYREHPRRSLREEEEENIQRDYTRHYKLAWKEITAKKIST